MARVFIINTNKTNNPSDNPTRDEMDMISKQKCSAYYAPWKYRIETINSNDLVFLYSNGRGIIARGLATGVVEITDHEGKEDEEYYMHLNRFENLSTPLPASVVSDIVNYSVVWGQTMISLEYKAGLKVWQYITKHHI